MSDKAKKGYCFDFDKQTVTRRLNPPKQGHKLFFPDAESVYKFLLEEKLPDGSGDLSPEDRDDLECFGTLPLADALQKDEYINELHSWALTGELFWDTDIESILEEDDAGIDQKNHWGQTAVDICFSRRDYIGAAVLIEGGADVEEGAFVAMFGEKAVSDALETSHVQLLEFCLDDGFEYDETHLALAIAAFIAQPSHSSNGMLDFFVENLEPDVFLKKCQLEGESAAYSALDRACDCWGNAGLNVFWHAVSDEADYEELSKCASPNGSNLAHLLARLDGFRVFEGLLSSHPELFGQINRFGESPAFVAAQRLCSKNMDSLIRAGVDLEVRDASGLTVLNYLAGAVFHKNDCGKQADLISKLISAGAKLSTQDDAGDTPLHRAGSSERARLDIKIVRRLLDANAPLDVVNKKGATPADVACMQAKALMEEKTLKQLLADVPAPNRGKRVYF